MIQLLPLWSTVCTVTDKVPSDYTDFIKNNIRYKIISTRKEKGKHRQHLPLMIQLYMIERNHFVMNDINDSI